MLIARRRYDFTGIGTTCSCIAVTVLQPLAVPEADLCRVGDHVPPHPLRVPVGEADVVARVVTLGRQQLARRAVRWAARVPAPVWVVELVTRRIVAGLADGDGVGGSGDRAHRLACDVWVQVVRHVEETTQSQILQTQSHARRR